MEISRWREPPDRCEGKHTPRQGCRSDDAFPLPLPGRVFVWGRDPVACATG